MKMALKSTISALASIVLLSASLMAVAQNAQDTGAHIQFRGNPEFGDPVPLKAPDPADFLSPDPMGPPQTFAVAAPASRADAPAQTPTPHQRAGHKIRNSSMTAQAERPRVRYKGTQTASARPRRLDAGPNAVTGGESALSFAPLERKRTRPSQPCFPLSAFGKNGLEECNTGTYRGRFEELLAE